MEQPAVQLGPLARPGPRPARVKDRLPVPVEDVGDDPALFPLKRPRLVPLPLQQLRQRRQDTEREDARLVVLARPEPDFASVESTADHRSARASAFRQPVSAANRTTGRSAGGSSAITRSLKIARAQPLATALVEELKAFEIHHGAAGRDSYGAWREGTHDDLVLAVAVAAWWAERQPSYREQEWSDHRG